MWNNLKEDLFQIPCEIFENKRTLSFISEVYHIDIEEFIRSQKNMKEPCIDSISNFVLKQIFEFCYGQQNVVSNPCVKEILQTHFIINSYYTFSSFASNHSDDGRTSINYASYLCHGNGYSYDELNNCMLDKKVDVEERTYHNRRWSSFKDEPTEYFREFTNTSTETKQNCIGGFLCDFTTAVINSLYRNSSGNLSIHLSSLYKKNAEKFTQKSKLRDRILLCIDELLDNNNNLNTYCISDYTKFDKGNLPEHLKNKDILFHCKKELLYGISKLDLLINDFIYNKEDIENSISETDNTILDYYLALSLSPLSIRFNDAEKLPTSSLRPYIDRTSFITVLLPLMNHVYSLILYNWYQEIIPNQSHEQLCTIVCNFLKPLADKVSISRKDELSQNILQKDLYKKVFTPNDTVQRYLANRYSKEQITKIRDYVSGSLYLSLEKNIDHTTLIKRLLIYCVKHQISVNNDLIAPYKHIIYLTLTKNIDNELFIVKTKGTNIESYDEKYERFFFPAAYYYYRDSLSLFTNMEIPDSDAKCIESLEDINNEYQKELENSDMYDSLVYNKYIFSLQYINKNSAKSQKDITEEEKLFNELKRFLFFQEKYPFKDLINDSHIEKQDS